MIIKGTFVLFGTFIPWGNSDAKGLYFVLSS